MDLKMEESLLFDLWEFYFNIMKIREAKATLWRHDEGANLSAAAFQVEQSSDALEKAALFLKVDTKSSKKKKIYVREMILGFFKINVSYFKSPKSIWMESDNAVDSLLDIDRRAVSPNSSPGGQDPNNVDDAFVRWSESSTSGADERSQHASINIIAAVFPSISKAPIRFQERTIYHVYEAEGDIWKSLKSFYSAEALRQIYKIVGSLGKQKRLCLQLNWLPLCISLLDLHAILRLCWKSHYGSDLVQEWSSRLFLATISRTKAHREESITSWSWGIERNVIPRFKQCQRHLWVCFKPWSNDRGNRHLVDSRSALSTPTF